MSSRQPRSVSADLAAANAVLDVCAALTRAQGDEAAPVTAAAPEMPKPDPVIEHECERLAELESQISAVTSRFQGAGQSGGAAAAISECVVKIIAERRDALASSHRPTPIASSASPPKERDFATERALAAALDRYFSYFEIPGTSWGLQWRLFGDQGMPVATAHGTSPERIVGCYPVPLPEEAPWRAATRLTELEAAPKTLTIVGAGPKPMSPGKFFLAGMSWASGAGCITLSRSKRKLSGVVRLDYPGDGTVAVVVLDDSGNAMAAGAAQSAETSAYLDAIWWKLSAFAMGLIHGRGDATTLTHDGLDVVSHPEPIRLADAMMSLNEELLAKVESEVDDSMRAKLTAKFDGLSRNHRARLGGLAFAEESNPPAPLVSEEPVKDDEFGSASTTQMPVQTARIANSMFSQGEYKPMSGKVSRHTIARAPSTIGSGPAAMPKAAAPSIVSPIVEQGPAPQASTMFGQKTVDEKFEGLDLEIDWDDDDDDAPTLMKEDAPEDYSSETLPGLTPPVRLPTSVTITTR